MTPENKILILNVLYSITEHAQRARSRIRTEAAAERRKDVKAIKEIVDKLDDALDSEAGADNVFRLREKANEKLREVARRTRP